MYDGLACDLFPVLERSKFDKPKKWKTTLIPEFFCLKRGSWFVKRTVCDHVNLISRSTLDFRGILMGSEIPVVRIFHLTITFPPMAP